jgi:Bacterial extracellular solute-binding proteins, family 5 Middle
MIMTRQRRPADLLVRVLAVTAFLLPVAVRAALGPRYGGSVRVGALDLPDGAEPAFARGFGSRLLLGLRHETLVRLSSQGEPEAAIAVRWSPAAGGREWDIEIDGRATFHDGRPVTASDAVRSLRRFLRSDSPAGARLAALVDGGPSFRERATESVPGLASGAPGTMVLRLTSATRDLPAELAAPAAAVTASNGAACGPFILVHAVRDERAALVAFARHVAGRPFLDEVELLRFPDHEALQLALAKGSVDIALGEPGPSARRGRLLLVLDATRPVFRDIGVRRRVAAAIDRGVLAERFIPEGRPLCRLWWEVEPQPGCGAGVQPRSAPRTGMDSGSLALAVDKEVPVSASRRVVAHLMALGYRVEVRVLGSAAAAVADVDARLLLWAPEMDLPAAAMSEAAALPGVPGPVREIVREAAAPEGDAGAAETALLDSATVIPLAATTLFAPRDESVLGVREGVVGRLVLEDAWLPL